MAGLRIAPGLELPVDVAGEAIAILAKRGAGKTNTGRVLVEELNHAGVQVVVLDPVGAWWGLRGAADGKGPGLAMPVLGGAHGDVPLEATAGRLLADVVVDTGQSLGKINEGRVLVAIRDDYREVAWNTGLVFRATPHRISVVPL